MPGFNSEPAQTYQLNVLASALGRFASPLLDEQSNRQAGIFTEQVVETMLDDPKPIVPHTNPELLEEAIAFDAKLERQLGEGRAARLLPPIVMKEALSLVSGHRLACQSIRDGEGTVERLVDPEAIATSYGLPALWAETDAVITDELERWSSYAEHPVVPPDLQKPVSEAETNALLRLMWREVVGWTPEQSVRTYLVDSSQDFHVFWAPMASGLDYATPRNYDRATQLSFDLPHNATHLAHLDALPKELGAFRYDDSMAQRAYFEAATVFSEYRTIAEARENEQFREALHTILDPAQLSVDALAHWVIRDRGYEFKLRAARYMADAFMLQGVSYRDTSHAIAEQFQIPLADAEKETKKYLPWTGLGAVYSFGYRTLLEEGVQHTRDVFVLRGVPITTWEQRTALLGAGGETA